MQDVYKHFDEYDDPKAFNEYSYHMQYKYSNDIQDVYKGTDEKCKILIVFEI